MNHFSSHFLFPLSLFFQTHPPRFRCLSHFSFKPVSTHGAQEGSVTGCAARRLKATAETIRAERRRLPRCLSPPLYFQTRLGSELLVRRKQRCPTWQSMRHFSRRLRATNKIVFSHQGKYGNIFWWADVDLLVGGCGCTPSFVTSELLYCGVMERIVLSHKLGAWFASTLQTEWYAQTDCAYFVVTDGRWYCTYIWKRV